MAGCGRARFWCPKFKVPYTTGPHKYPGCSNLDSLDVSIPENARAKRYCNTVPRPRITTKQNMKVIYRAGYNHHANKGVSCRLHCLNIVTTTTTTTTTTTMDTTTPTPSARAFHQEGIEDSAGPIWS